MNRKPDFEKGQGFVEFAIVLVIVCIIILVGLALLGPAIGNIYANVVSVG
jgi:pilus assembly protein Flp/PilA